MVLNNWKKITDMFEKIIEKSKGNNVSEQIKKEIEKTSERKDTEPLNIKNVSNTNQARGTLPSLAIQSSSPTR